MQGGKIRSCRTWQCQSPSEQGGRIRCHGTHGSAGTLLSREAGHVAVHLAPCLRLKAVCGGTRSAGYQHQHLAPTVV
jgi:hypothetical protein